MPPSRMEPTATPSDARLSERFSLRAVSRCAQTGVMAPTAPRRNSNPMNVEIPHKRKRKNSVRNSVSTVRMAAARMAANERMRRTTDKKTREKQRVHREEREIHQQAPGCGTGRKFGGPPMPPAITFVQRGQRANQGRN